MRGVRGQVTAFILVGLLLLFVVLLLLFLQSRLAKTDGDPASLGQEYDADRIDSYVTQCLGLVGEQGLALISKQGGPIYTYQGGTFETWHALPIQILDEQRQPIGTSVNISFGLMSDSGFPFRPPKTHQECLNTAGCSGHDYHRSFWYPWPNYAFGSPSGLDRWNHWQYDGAFGQKGLAPLCDPDGPNSMTVGNANLLCPYTAKKGAPSLQGALASYIEHGLPNCLDKEQLANLLGSEVEMGRPTITVLLTRGETVLQAEIPLRFSSESTFRRALFTKRVPVRLFKTYAFTYDLLNRASKDPQFHFAEDYATVPGSEDFLVLQQPVSPEAVRLLSGTGRTDLYTLQVIDGGSEFKKGTWSLQLLIENRRPVLDLVRPVLTGQGCCPISTPRFTFSVNATDPDATLSQEELTARLTFLNHVTNAGASVKQISSDPITFEVSLKPGACQCFTCGSCYIRANLSVKDKHGLDDWQVFEVGFKNAPCSPAPPSVQ